MWYLTITFDFRTPYFYLKFLNGTLDYMLSASDYRRFLYTYERERRGVVERELLLSSSEKLEIEKLLIENSRPENKFYRYDFSLTIAQQGFGILFIGLKEYLVFLFLMVSAIISLSEIVSIPLSVLMYGVALGLI